MKRVSGRVLAKVLTRRGFELVRVKGSHHQFFKRGVGLITVPVHGHGDLKPGTQRNIMRAAGLTDEDL